MADPGEAYCIQCPIPPRVRRFYLVLAICSRRPSKQACRTVQPTRFTIPSRFHYTPLKLIDRVTVVNANLSVRICEKFLYSHVVIPSLPRLLDVILSLLIEPPSPRLEIYRAAINISWACVTIDINIGRQLHSLPLHS